MTLFYVDVNNSFSESNDTIEDDLYEAYKARETEQFFAYQAIAFFFGAIIFLSNVTVVISSGLLLKKDQHRKSTYLLLGNLSLADTIIGVSIVFGITIENPMSYNPLCIFQTGMLVCPAMVSIFTVGFIAVDRYIYILHGLYYQKWFTTTRVRMGILCIWVISIILAFLPASGWVNTELKLSRCYYVSLFPGALILLNSVLGIVPMILVAVLYTIILTRALKNVREIKATIKSVSSKSKDTELRVHIGGNDNLKRFSQTVKYPPSKDIKIHRTASFDETYSNSRVLPKTSNSRRSKSNENVNEVITFDHINIDIQNNRNSCYSEFSIQTISSRSQDMNSSMEIDQFNCKPKTARRKNISKVREPNKWRAIIVVMLTSGSFIFTWLPFFITVIFFVFCQEQFTNPRCMHLRMLLSGPIAILAFLNSILNPLIYAWWHKGFQRNIRLYFRKYILRFFKN